MKRIKFEFSNRDHIFDSFFIFKLSNSIYYKKHYDINKFLIFTLLKNLKEKHNINPLFGLKLSLQNGRNTMEITDVQRSGRLYKIAIPVSVNRQYLYFFKNISKSTRLNRSTSAITSLTQEFNNLILQTKGYTQSVNDAIYDTGITGLPFAHYRWR